MNRIDKIPAINKKCTGCSVCVDACPNGCIVQYVDNDGFTKVKVDVTSCIECEMCYKVCPAENFSKNSCDQHLFAAYSLDNNIKSRGSSGGIFELLASYCLNNKYYVCGAAFDDMKLKHMVVNTKKDLQSLLKSKYVQSSTVGIFNKVKELLKNREKEPYKDFIDFVVKNYSIGINKKVLISLIKSGLIKPILPTSS